MTVNTYVDRESGQQFEHPTQLVNTYIDRFSKVVSSATGSDVRFPLLDTDGFTSVKRGSATVGINVLAQSDVLIFVARIMKVPSSKTLECLRLLLELNYTATSDAAFAIEKSTDTICLRAQRSVVGLDYDEFEEILHTMATVADEWDDRLIAQFP